MNRRFGNRSSNTHINRLLAIAVLLCLSLCAIALPGCNVIKQLIGGGKGPGGGTLPGNQQAKGGGVVQRPLAPSGKKPLDGYWKLAFQLNDNVQSSHIKITQDGDKFSGEGTDDANDKPFFLENGLLKNGQVVFYKRYEHPDNPDSPPVEYSGTFDASSGSPYMSGEFLVAHGQEEVKGAWEAQMEGTEGAATPQPAQTEQAPQQTQSQPEKAPDLTGKWNVGFEYQFKTIHSTLFMEQYKNTLTGHGVDENTNEKFVIEKGWYNYPKVTIIWKYPATKTKKVSKPERRMIFKADVSWVSDKDYTGPYMSGKTDGGGNWEAQRVN